MQLFLFYKDLKSTIPHLSNQLSGVIFDWEYKGKQNRQKDFNTEVNNHGTDRIYQVRNIYQGEIIVRINGGQYIDESEIKTAIDLGASEIFLPMVKSLKEIEMVLKIINNQCKFSILLETNESVKLLDQIKTYPITKFFFGLNDYAIQNNLQSIFTPLDNGLIEKVSSQLSGRRFGFGGLTHPDKGHPIKCGTLMEKMYELKCDFGFLRRSFYTDVNEYSSSQIYEEIEAKWKVLSSHDILS